MIQSDRSSKCDDQPYASTTIYKNAFSVRGRYADQIGKKCSHNSQRSYFIHLSELENKLQIGTPFLATKHAAILFFSPLDPLVVNQWQNLRDKQKIP